MDVLDFDRETGFDQLFSVPEAKDASYGAIAIQDVPPAEALDLRTADPSSDRVYAPPEQEKLEEGLRALLKEHAGLVAGKRSAESPKRSAEPPAPTGGVTAAAARFAVKDSGAAAPQAAVAVAAPAARRASTELVRDLVQGLSPPGSRAAALRAAAERRTGPRRAIQTAEAAEPIRSRERRREAEYSAIPHSALAARPSAVFPERERFRPRPSVLAPPRPRLRVPTSRGRTPSPPNAPEVARTLHFR